jgi:hypothetical protein
MAFRPFVSIQAARDLELRKLHKKKGAPPDMVDEKTGIPIDTYPSVVKAQLVENKDKKTGKVNPDKPLKTTCFEMADGKEKLLNPFAQGEFADGYPVTCVSRLAGGYYFTEPTIQGEKREQKWGIRTECGLLERLEKKSMTGGNEGSLGRFTTRSRVARTKVLGDKPSSSTDKDVSATVVSSPQTAAAKSALADADAISMKRDDKMSGPPANKPESAAAASAGAAAAAAAAATVVVVPPAKEEKAEAKAEAAPLSRAAFLTAPKKAPVKVA